MTPNDIDRFRGWALAALYASMAVLCLMLGLAAFQVWPSIQDGATEVVALVGLGAATAVTSARACHQFVRILRAGERPPKFAMLPFAFMALTMLAASNLFTGV